MIYTGIFTPNHINLQDLILTKTLGYNIISLEFQLKHLELKRGEIMKLSTRGRYGLKAIFELSSHYGEGPVPLNEIASKQNLSESYLEQLFSVLRREGVITSVRGAQGGYMISRDPEEITVGQVLRSLEGDMAPSDCILEGDEIACPREDECVTKIVWIKIKESIDNVIDSITLKDMLDDQNKAKVMEV